MARGTPKKAKRGALTQLDLFRLSRWNRRLAFVYLLEALAIFIFASAYSIPVIANYLAVNPINTTVTGHTVLSAATRQLFNVSIPGLVTVVFLVSVLAHAVLATVYRKRYEDELSRGVNMVRWLEYGISAGLMLVLVGLVTGICDLATLIALFGFMVVMNLLGLVMELTSKDSQPNWAAYCGGVAAGFVPWLIVGLFAFNATYYGAAHIPSYVYGLYVTMLVCSSGFALNLYAHYKKQGKWANYVTTERSFMILSLITKTLLAWQIFAGILRP